MDLGIRGKKAIVCASSRGLGRGCAMALGEAGVDLTLNGRDATALGATAKEIRDRFGVTKRETAIELETIRRQRNAQAGHHVKR